MPETCANCGGAIGNLETPRVWNDHVVCVACHEKLVPAVVGYAGPAMPGRTDPIQSPPQRKTQTVEQTGKSWKLQQLLSVLCIVVGATLTMVGYQTQARAIGAIGAVLLLAGFAWYAFARIGAWWFHG